jgi:hypothetical protein
MTSASRPQLRLVDAVKRHEMPGHIRRDMGHEAFVVVELVPEHVLDPVFFQRDHGRVRELSLVSAMLGQDLGAASGVALDGVDRAPTADGGNFRVKCDHKFTFSAMKRRVQWTA